MYFKYISINFGTFTLKCLLRSIEYVLRLFCDLELLLLLLSSALLLILFNCVYLLVANFQ